MHVLPAPEGADYDWDSLWAPVTLECGGSASAFPSREQESGGLASALHISRSLVHVLPAPEGADYDWDSLRA